MVWPRSHTWSPDTPDPNHLYPSVEFMPQLWGYDQVSDFENVVQAGYASIILGMNESVQYSVWLPKHLTPLQA